MEPTCELDCMNVLASLFETLQQMYVCVCWSRVKLRPDSGEAGSRLVNRNSVLSLQVSVRPECQMFFLLRRLPGIKVEYGVKLRFLCTFLCLGSLWMQETSNY